LFFGVIFIHIKVKLTCSINSPEIEYVTENDNNVFHQIKANWHYFYTDIAAIRSNNPLKHHWAHCNYNLWWYQELCHVTIPRTASTTTFQPHV